MTTDIMHQPTPEFRDYLENEVTREFRRHRLQGRLRLTAVFVAAMAVGTTAGLASAQIRETSQRDSLLEAAKANLSLAGVRLELARALLADRELKMKIGAIGPSSLVEAQTELRQMEAQARMAQLNIEEIQASSLAARDDLNAPLVGGRDFVTERLQLELFLAQNRLNAAEQSLAEAERQARIGAVSELTVQDARLEGTRARAALGVLAERRKLRKEFLEQGTAVDQLNLRLQLAQVQLEAHVTDEAVKVLRQRLDGIRKQHSAGAVTELDVLRADVQLKERIVELELLVRKLRQLRKPE